MFVDYYKKTSLSIQDWLETLDEITTIFKNKDLKNLSIKHEWLKSILNKLEVHFVETKSDAEGYIKDKKKLKEALDVIEYRRKTVETLLNELC